MKHCPNPECSFLAETGQAGEYRDEISVCSDCGAALEPGRPPRVDQKAGPRWTGVLVATDPHAVHLARSFLAREGIPSEVRPTRKESELLLPGQAAGAEIIVPSPLAEAARDLLENQPLEPVQLPDHEDLEFIDADSGTPLENEPGGEESHPPPCPHCSSSSVERTPPGSPVEPRGFLKRLFSPPPRWICRECRHLW
ncbi:MAG: hypothetical protein ACE5HD_00600 [Acidobacteriota bacterium]